MHLISDRQTDRQADRPSQPFSKVASRKMSEKVPGNVSVVNFFYVKFAIIKKDSTINVSLKFSESFGTNNLWKTFKEALV